MSEKKPYYRKRKASAKTKPSEVETNATSLDATSSTTPASDRVVAGSAQQKPKRKRYHRKPKSRLATEAEAWAVSQQSIADTDSKTIEWTDAVRSTAAERGIDQMGYPVMPEGFSPAEDAKSKNSNNAVKQAMQKHNEIMHDKLKYNSNTDSDNNIKPYASKSDHMLREHKLISAIALAIVFLGLMCVLSVWWMLTHG